LNSLIFSESKEPPVPGFPKNWQFPRKTQQFKVVSLTWFFDFRDPVVCKGQNSKQIVCFQRTASQINVSVGSSIFWNHLSRV
jgi:hypothetical protein